jgi:GNAT superfamily N-acetyltransferase
VPFLLFHFAVGDGELPFDNCLQAVMILFGKRGEFKWLAIPSHRGQHLGVACYAAIAAEEHQLSDHARLHRALQAQEAAGYGNYLQLRGASDAARKPYYHRGFFFESDTLRPFTKLSLGGVGHELSITILVKNREITEGQKSRSIRPTAKPPA